MNRKLAGWMLAVLALCHVGCPAKGPTPAPPSSLSTTTDGGPKPAVTPDEPPTDKPAVFQLGDLIKPFTPPTLDELNAQVKWIDQPVVDSLDMLREKLAGEKPLVTVEGALKMKNQGAEDNKTILSALCQLPENDAATNWDARIIRHLPADIKAVNPLLISSTSEFDIVGLTSFGLFGFDWEMKPHATKDTVVSWQVSEDRLYDKVVMRGDLTWSDGQPITAHDVAFSFQAILTSAIPVTAVRSGTDKLKWIEAYDDHTVVFFHQDAAATNVWNLNFTIVPKHVYAKSVAEDPTLIDSKYHVEQENNPVAGGLYTISRRIRDQEIILERRESWYMHGGKQVRPKPYFKEIHFKIIQDQSVALLALKKAELEEQVLTPEQWQNLTGDETFYGKNTKLSAVEWVDFYIGYNFKTPFFSDVKVRKAMSLALDHDRMLKVLRYDLDQPCYGPFHPAAPYAPKQTPQADKFYNKQDLDRAEALLDEAGWSDHDNDGFRDKTIDGKLVPFEFTILVSNQQWRIDICNLFRQNLEQIGVLCNIRPLEPATLQSNMESHKYQAAFGGWGTGTDPDTSVNIFGTDEGRNYGQYSNKKIDELYEQGRKEFDLTKRYAIYAQIHEILYEDQVYTWLFFRNAFYGFNKDLRGINFSPRGPFHYGPGFSSIWKPAEM